MYSKVASRRAAIVLPDLKDADFAVPFDRFAAPRIVKQSTGTAQFYRVRAAITRRLIEFHGFTAVALEADWPDV